MKREDFQKALSETAKEIEKLFTYKNNSYGMEDDVFHNFRTTARRVIKAHYDDEHEDMFRVLACYVDKHWVALCNRGLHEPEFVERCRDIITYMLIAVGMYNEWQNLDQEECCTCKYENTCCQYNDFCKWEPKEGR